MLVSNVNDARFAAMATNPAIDAKPDVTIRHVSMKNNVRVLFRQKSQFASRLSLLSFNCPHHLTSPALREIERLSKKLEKCSSILRCLFPNHEVESLAPLSREELCNLLEQRSPQPTEQLPSPPLRTPNSQLFDLEQIPAQDAEWDEERRERDPLPAEADDVNALSLTLDRQTSYLGISSVRAAMLVMVHIQPQLQASLAFHQRNSTRRHIEETLTSHNPVETTEETVPVRWTLKGQALVDAYFKGCHVFTPMLDEVSFRADYLNARRHDAPWLSLLNMVFAIGSIMATKSSDMDHFKYYEEAMKHLSLAALGSSCIETVQALALLGGHYLHYINRPNMANAILGATIRMASALGLHREPANQVINNTAAGEMRRRTWWSLFCLDTWTTTTMGRPSFGRCDPSIDIQPPQLLAEQVSLVYPLMPWTRLTVSTLGGTRLCTARRGYAFVGKHQVLQDRNQDSRYARSSVSLGHRKP